MINNIVGAECLSGKYILYAEDNAVVSSVTVKVLNKFKMDVQHVENGQEALEIYYNHGNEFDLVILDVMMPHKNGFEVATNILEDNPDTKILLCSGYYKATDDEADIVVKTKGFLQKPYSCQKFISTLIEIFDES